MDAHHFDRFTVAFSHPATRRSALALLSALGATAFVAEEARAVCIANGKRCDPKAAPNGCCSGKCSRKKKRCARSVSQSTCTVDEDVCSASGGAQCSATASPCACVVTTKGLSFCGDSSEAGSDCTPCTKDDQCTALTGPGSVCLPAGPNCCLGTSSVCLSPCKTPV
jgi:hypothetical protein